MFQRDVFTRANYMMTITSSDGEVHNLENNGVVLTVKINEELPVVLLQPRWKCVVPVAWFNVIPLIKSAILAADRSVPVFLVSVGQQSFCRRRKSN